MARNSARAPIRVRYKDTDCMKVVYYGNYLTYFEIGRVEYLCQAGHLISEVDAKVHIPVVEAHVRYTKPAVPRWLQAMMPVPPAP